MEVAVLVSDAVSGSIDNERNAKRLKVGHRTVKLEPGATAEDDAGAKPFSHERVFHPDSTALLSSVPNFELWWPSEQLQQDTLDAHGIITEMLTSVEAGLDAYAIEVGETAYWKLPPLEIGVNGDWTSGWSKTSGQLS